MGNVSRKARGVCTWILGVNFFYCDIHCFSIGHSVGIVIHFLFLRNSRPDANYFGFACQRWMYSGSMHQVTHTGCSKSPVTL
ncbi:hypothetical protein BDV38DRAFT_232806 [Aspergillus pseudotamarii]|uniref:Uncharacterized protein n=1 Tax=Aspergillus pseudotamarii TaxID=132259 RepID=A0A5N6T9Y9_ASPPS|nr:uncharacterized protein BDV38DRAFT_232806 [Aspergillus pseudotamarii]KAE8143122.1 hypothetical protein BDV38DRAFT_232806 [Aspergillus pseudotamarii]